MLAPAALLVPAVAACGTAARQQAQRQARGGPVFAVAKVGSPAGGVARPALITVEPARGGRHTRFTVSFVAPEATGTIAGQRRIDHIEASPAHGYIGCASGVEIDLPPTAAGVRVVSVLDPARIGAGPWCLGTFAGKITQQVEPVCAPGAACPQFMAIRGVVGTFRFRVLK
jgi:hypothetical protein